MPRVAIIGGGPSGLVAARYALLEGLEPVIFEQHSELGGIWHPKTGKTWDDMHTNLSKFSCMFSDLVWDENSEMFPSRDTLYHYLCRYAEKFNLKKHFQFNSRVLNVKQNADKWQISYETSSTSVAQKPIAQGPIQKTESFDFVIIATGIFSEIYVPAFPGLANFKGKTLHSGNYKNPYSLPKDKNIVVIGSSFTATEIAADISKHVVKPVVNVFEKPHYILERNLTAGSSKLPVDLLFYRRAPRKSLEEVTQKTAQDNAKGHQYLDGLCKAQRAASKALEIDPNSVSPTYVAISDHYVTAVQTGKIQAEKGKIDHFTENHVVLSDQTKIPADIVVFCTGYKLKLSFLDKSLQELLRYQYDDQLQPVLLYQSTFHPEIPGMAFTGVYRGPSFSAMELQARWASLIFSKKLLLPAIAIMKKGIEEENAIRQLKPRPQFPHGDYLGFAESLAKQIGCDPDFEKLKKDNNELYDQLWAGPLLPTHYKLRGPQADPKALIEQLEQLRKVLNPQAAMNATTTSSQNVKPTAKPISESLTAYNMTRCILAGVVASLGAYIGYKIATKGSTGR